MINSGSWNAIDHLNLSRVSEHSIFDDPTNIMANRTFVVSLLINEPYTMLKMTV